MTLLGVNIDHVATLRQARGEPFPDPVAAAQAAVEAGADGITAHLREDRRHIQDRDVARLKAELSVPFNLEMAATPEIVRLAVGLKPAWVCLVPERRQELTTEGGLDVKAHESSLAENVKRLKGAGIRVSLFIESELGAVETAARVGADAVELHTGVYARVFRRGEAEAELARLRRAAAKASELKLLVNAGHGIDYANVGPLAQAYAFHEFNIGFSILAQALFTGLAQAVKQMKSQMRALCVES